MHDPINKSSYASIVGGRRDALREQIAQTISSGAGPLVWEVGCGHGHFLTAYAAAHPDILCVGIDLESSRIIRAKKKQDRARLANLHFIRAEARLFLDSLPENARISGTFILFPDPWPKTRHHKHRVMQPNFLDALAAKTAAGARLCFRTDYAPYFAETRATLAKSTTWELVEEPWPFEFETVFQSRATRHESLIARRRQA